jgi:hypothetical protein
MGERGYVLKSDISAESNVETIRIIVYSLLYGHKASQKVTATEKPMTEYFYK